MSGANAVKEDRLWQRHADMAKLGGTPKGGVNRQALSPEDAAARKQLAAWAKARGFDVFTDAIGNLFIRKNGTDPALAPVLSGSHMDSQPTGGRFDGMYGVLAAFEALEALEDAGVTTKRPVMAVAWTNEEGSRFQPGAMGSAVFAGAYKLDEMLGAEGLEGRRAQGRAGRDADRRARPAARGAPGFAVDSYIEAHIEQGPRLENERQDDRRRHRASRAAGATSSRSTARRRMPAPRRAPRARTPTRAATRHRGGDVRGDDRRRRHAALHHRPGRGLARLAQHGAGQGRRSPSTCAIPTTRCWTQHEATLEAIVAAKATPCPARIER